MPIRAAKVREGAEGGPVGRRHRADTSFPDFRDGSRLARARMSRGAVPDLPDFFGVRGDGERSGYKYMAEGDIRYDRVLLTMGGGGGGGGNRPAGTGHASPCRLLPRRSLCPPVAHRHRGAPWAALYLGSPGSGRCLTWIEGGHPRPAGALWHRVRPGGAGARAGADAGRATPRRDVETPCAAGRYWMEGANDASAPAGAVARTAALL